MFSNWCLLQAVFSHPLSLSLSHFLTFSLSHFLPLSLSPSLTLLTLSLCHTLTLSQAAANILGAFAHFGIQDAALAAHLARAIAQEDAAGSSRAEGGRTRTVQYLVDLVSAAGLEAPLDQVIHLPSCRRVRDHISTNLWGT